MSSYRDLYGSATHAREQMKRNRRLSEQLFAELLDSNPRAGLVYLFRAVGFEEVGELVQARADYQRAEELLEGDEWKAKARAGSERVVACSSDKSS